MSVAADNKQMVAMAAKTAIVTSKILLAVLNHIGDNIDEKLKNAKTKAEREELMEAKELNEKLKEHVRAGGQLRSIRVFDSQVKDILKILKEGEITFTASSISVDNIAIITYKDEDEQYVEDLIVKYKNRSEMTTELDKVTFLSKFHEERICALHDVDPVEVELIRELSLRDESALQFYVDWNDNGQASLFFAESESRLLVDVVEDYNWVLSGNDGARVKEIIEDTIEKRSILLEAINDEEKNIKIVSKTDPDTVIEINENGFTHRKRGQKLRTRNRNDENFDKTILAIIAEVGDSTVYIDGEEKFDVPENLAFAAKGLINNTDITSPAKEKFDIEIAKIMDIQGNIDNPELEALFFGDELKNIDIDERSRNCAERMSTIHYINDIKTETQKSKSDLDR